MTYCEFCGDQISYLPFSCKFCGGTYCKKHRLPENHECTFELKHVPVTPVTPRESRHRSQYTPKRKTSSKDYLEKGPRVLKKYLKRQDKQRAKTFRSSRRFDRATSQFQATKVIFILIIVLTISAMFFSFYGIGEYLFLSLNGLATKFTFHTLFTSIFIDPINPYDPFFFFSLMFIFIMLFFTNKIAKIIEMARGSKFLVYLFLISGFFSILFYFLLRLALILYYPIFGSFLDWGGLKFLDGVGLVWGGIYGVITYTIFPSLNRETSALVTFVRVRMTGKAFLYMIIIFRLFFGLLYGFTYDFLYFLYYLPELGGILGSYVVYKYRLFSK